MDTLRGNFGTTDYGDDERDYDSGEDETGRELPPVAIGTDERRMQVRAYNHWAGQLEDRTFPSIEDLDPENLNDFGPYSVLLDFSVGLEDPAIQYLGKELAGECGAEGAIKQLSDVPSRSLLSRITDHYMQILANQAPIGFEAEFVNQRGTTILYRGILLPYSSDGETIDFIYGVINWKEIADQITTDELLLEIDQALETSELPDDTRSEDPVTDWADGPATSIDNGADAFPKPTFGEGMADGTHDAFEDASDDAVARLSSLIQSRDTEPASDELDDDWENGEGRDPLASLRNEQAGTPVENSAVAPLEASPLLKKKTKTVGHGLGSMFETDGEESLYEGAADGHLGENENSVEEADDRSSQSASLARLGGGADDAVDSNLYDCLAEARELAQNARTSEDRTRQALYDAVGRAYDVSLAAQDEPEEFEQLVAENGLSVQDRAPMTPVVKLVFGADYDKTRLTEYAAVLQHAQRVGIERGALARFLSNAEGGLKGVVQAERRMRKEESGKEVAPTNVVRPALAKKLRNVEARALDTLAPDGPEFAVVLVRRTEDGDIVLLGEVEDDIPLVEKVARKFV